MRWSGLGSGLVPRAPRLLIGDAQPLFADALAALLAARGHDIAARVTSRAEAAAALANPTWNFALLDADLVDPVVIGPCIDSGPGRNFRIILLAPGPGHAGVGALLAAIDGLVFKDAGADALFHCLAVVASGRQCFDPRALATDTPDQLTMLTRRETEIARHVATGRRNRDIADALGISEGTVKMHLHNAYTKLGVESRTQLAMDRRIRALA